MENLNEESNWMTYESTWGLVKEEAAQRGLAVEWGARTDTTKYKGKHVPQKLELEQIRLILQITCVRFVAQTVSFSVNNAFSNYGIGITSITSWNFWKTV